MNFHFGDIEVNTDTHHLIKGSQSIHIEPLTLNLIVYLIAQKNRAVSRAELFDQLWNGRIVTDASLSNEIKEARKILGDNGRQQRIIRTIHGYGYQFVADLNETVPLSINSDVELVDPGEKLFESIPVHSSGFIGRINELDAIKETLINPENRSVSIIGPGGIGKTSLAIQIAYELKPIYQGGIFFISLVTETHSSNVLLHIAKLFNIPEHAFNSANPDSRVKTLAKYLSGKKKLIILDNFEHLLRGSEDLALLSEATHNIQFVITSRERTNLAGEQTLVLDGLSLAGENDRDSFKNADAVKLFLDRATREISQLNSLQDHNDKINQICTRLGGSPLGIVLAVSWLRIMNIDKLATEISYSMLKDLELPLNLDPRHQKINNLFDSSWTHLSDELQIIFMKLSVFIGGFTIESAMGVSHCTLSQLMLLEQFSLVKKHVNGRFTVHELLRQFGEEKLINSGSYDSTLMNMMSYYLDLAKEKLPYIITQNKLELLNSLRQELPNFYKVCEMAVTLQRWEDVCELIVFNGYVDNQILRCFEVNRTIVPVIKDKVPLKLYLKVLRQLLKGYRLMNLTDFTRLKLSKDYVEIGKTLNHKGIEGEGYSFLFDCYVLQPEPGRDHMQYLELAYSCYKDYMDHFQGPKNSEFVYYAIHLGDESASTERWDDCKYYYLLAMDVAEKVGDQRLHEICYWGAALGYLLTGDGLNGLLYCQRSLDSYLKLENILAYANRIPGVALGARLFGDNEQATQMLGQAQGLIERITGREAPAETFTNEGDIKLLQQSLGNRVFEEIWQAGKKDQLSTVVSYVNQYINDKHDK